MKIKRRVIQRMTITEQFVQRYIDLFDDTNRLFWDPAFVKEETFLKGPIPPEAIIFGLIGKGLTEMFGPARMWNSGEFLCLGAPHLNEALVLELKLGKKYYEEFPRYRVKFRAYHIEWAKQLDGDEKGTPRILYQGDVWCTPLMSQTEYNARLQQAHERVVTGGI